MGAYRSAMMPLQARAEGLVSMTGMPLHHMGMPLYPQRLLPKVPGFRGMPSFGKSAVIAAPPAVQLLPVY